MNQSLSIFVLTAIVWGAGSSVPGAEDVKTKPWEGVWTAISVENNGERLPAEKAKNLRLTLTADRYKTQMGDQILFDSNYTVDTTKNPAHIDIVGTEGEFKGKVALGLIKVDGDMLTMCYVMPGGERPGGLTSPPGSRVTLLVMQRIETK
jgi:uncharacterized protein (TIGR03067 family)